MIDDFWRKFLFAKAKKSFGFMCDLYLRTLLYNIYINEYTVHCDVIATIICDIFLLLYIYICYMYNLNTIRLNIYI